MTKDIARISSATARETSINMSFEKNEGGRQAIGLLPALSSAYLKNKLQTELDVPAFGDRLTDCGRDSGGSRVNIRRLEIGVI